MKAFTKLKNAPNMKLQKPNAENAYIIIGSQAWDFAKAPPAERTQGEIALDDVLPQGEKSPPIVLTGEVLKNVHQYRIAPEQAHTITLQRANHGEAVSGEIIAKLCLNLANNTQAKAIHYIDEAEQHLEDLSGYIERIRQGEAMAENVAEVTASDDVNADIDKHKPYVEKRTENGVEGLYRITPKYDKDTGELLSERTEWLSDEIAVVGIGQSEAEHYLVLEWTPEGKSQPVKEALSLGDLGEREGWRQLKAKGLRLTTRTYLRNELADYLQSSGKRTLWHITNATGWHNGAYILPNGEVLGEPETPVLFNRQSATASGYDTKGTIESWRQEIADNVRGNPSMMLGVACALSAPIMNIIEAESFGVHLFGGSTAGKTTTANIASSLYGHPDKIRLSWNATGLGLINEASARNDNFMPLDEIGQGSNRKYIEQTAYALFNGMGKIQGAKDGGNRELQRWRIMAFSTGEIDLEGYLSMGGIKTNAGQLVRLLNVPITRAKVYHSFPDGKAHADHLNYASKQHYGAVGRAWIEWLTVEDNQKVLIIVHSQMKTKWLDRLPSDASPQVQRVASRFAILETALQLASFLTGWDISANGEALLHCFNEWINIFGLHSQEEKQIIEQVNGWLLANAEGRFIEYPNNPEQRAISNIAGYKIIPQRDNEIESFYLYPLAFEEAIKGHPKEQACKILSDKGMLSKGENGYRYLVRIPSRIDPKRTRCYLVFPLVESDEA
ncbi:DUF927 domain-containing protein [Actinobacillus indolicus]|uniref:DUF927 domain-containing protein n=1 Tax=Actinobacillus indolicus TaxID=51049 RepID=A0A4P7CFU7_9PAST|nr:DUF927 domain-containing protein [Actinobacillus indolicus]QBQ63878.1 DUF927 domain-containing protein [Actinobacillus indolicus]